MRSRRDQEGVYHCCAVVLNEVKMRSRRVYHCSQIIRSCYSAFLFKCVVFTHAVYHLGILQYFLSVSNDATVTCVMASLAVI